MGNNRAAGAEYERKAAQYLQSLGYQVIAKNFRCRLGEIDMIAKDKEYLVFIEVKYRANTHLGHPLEAVHVRKQRTICKAAAFYTQRYGISDQQPCRFDVLGYVDGTWTLIKNAFDYIE